MGHVFLGALLLIAVADSPAARPDTTLETLTRWVAVVDSHQPGERDAAVIAVASLSPDERLQLIDAAGPFVGYLRKRSQAKADGTSADADPVASPRFGYLGERLLSTRTLTAWLHRAIILETDAAILAPELTATAMQNARDSRLRPAMHAEDGAAGAQMFLNWHWEFARTLVAMRDVTADDRFERDWYHATGLYMLDEALLGELAPHLAAAFQAFPSDPRMQFDLACLSDAYGSAKVQAILTGDLPKNFRVNVPAQDAAEATAARQFARVLEMDPTFAEARVRLARLTEKHGDAGGTLTLLAPVFNAPADPSLAYIAHLTAARAAQRLGDIASAAGHIAAARRLFPRAQSPYVQLSRLALESGDSDGAIAAAAALRTLENRDDPWWIYFQATWLGWETRLDALRNEVRR
jgi:hypothetical protein